MTDYIINTPHCPVPFHFCTIPRMNTNPIFQRLKILTGADTVAALSQTRVSVFGLGGVGSWCSEALVRSGIGAISLIDFDKVEISNINRQIQATMGSIGRFKADVLAARLKEINPDCDIKSICAFYELDTADQFDISGTDYIIDAIDSLESKLDLIESAVHLNITLYSSMGMAWRLDPTRIKTASIWKTSGCPLARRVREGLRKRDFKGDFTAVYSDEIIPREREIHQGKMINGSAVPVTAAAGMILASLIIRDIAGRYDGVKKDE